MRSFSSRVMEAPGDCSPSRRVVSKMISLSVMVFFRWAGGRKQNGPLQDAGGPLAENLDVSVQCSRETPEVPSRAAVARIDMATC